MDVLTKHSNIINVQFNCNVNCYRMAEFWSQFWKAGRRCCLHSTTTPTKKNIQIEPSDNTAPHGDVRTYAYETWCLLVCECVSVWRYKISPYTFYVSFFLNVQFKGNQSHTYCSERRIRIVHTSDLRPGTQITMATYRFGNFDRKLESDQCCKFSISYAWCNIFSFRCISKLFVGARHHFGSKKLNYFYETKIWIFFNRLLFTPLYVQ